MNHPLSYLQQTTTDLVLNAISHNTMQSYWTAWSSFKQFHALHSLPFPSFDTVTISSFITHAFTLQNLSPATIKAYLSGVHFMHKLIYGSDCQSFSDSRVSLLLKGIRKQKPRSSPDLRLPITRTVLAACLTTLYNGFMSFHTNFTLAAMFVLAFFGMLRCGEFTCPNHKFNPAIHPCIADLEHVDENTMRFLVKQSKTDQFRKGHPIFIFNLDSDLNPHQYMSRYLAYRSSQSPPSCPLFVTDNGTPVTRHTFQCLLKSVLANSGFSPERYSAHSFRIGAATTAATKGLSEQQIKTLGRWSSDAYALYVRTNLADIRRAHQALAS